MKTKFIDFKKFTKTYFIYANNKPDCRWTSYRGGLRLIFRLPNGVMEYHYPTKKELSNKDLFIQELEAVLFSGYLPTKSLKKLDVAVDEFKTPALNAIENYYSIYNTGKREKNRRTVIVEKTFLVSIFNGYFDDLGIKYIQDVTTDHLVQFNKDVESFKHRITKETISLATVETYKRIIKAFFNCLIAYGVVDKDVCDPTKICASSFRGGAKNYQATARLVHIPQRVIDNIRKAKYKQSLGSLDMRSLFAFAAETGLRKQELLTLSLHNLYPTPESFDSIRIFNKSDCPTIFGMGFTVKSENSERIIPAVILSDKSIAFLKLCIAETKVRKTEYPFLFMKFKNGEWSRIDDFKKSFQTIITSAKALCKDLVQKETYTFHDFRRSLNLKLRDLGYKPEEVAYILGHNLLTNEQNYYAIKEKNYRLLNGITERALQLSGGRKPSLRVVNE